MKRIMAVCLACSLGAGISWPDHSRAAIGSAPIQTAASGRGLGVRGPASRPPVRRYRSYSIEPRAKGHAAKPSYMQGDSKARGRFHE